MLVKNARAQGLPGLPVVRAVLFFRSSCAHCQQLVAEVLPPLQQSYGDQLQIFRCDVSTPVGDALFTSAIQQYNIQLIGVPTVIVADKVLIGTDNISQQFPLIIQEGLSQGGLDWPDIPGLEQARVILEAVTPTPERPPADYGPPSSAPIVTFVPVDLSQNDQVVPVAPAVSKVTVLQQAGINFNRDPAGNTLSVFVLIGLLGFFFVAVHRFLRKSSRAVSKIPHWSIPSSFDHRLCDCGVPGVSGDLPGFGHLRTGRAL